MSDASQKGPCPHSTDCAMYRLFKLSGSLQVWKINYCNADYERCARYRRSALGQQVPLTLMPNGEHLKKAGG